MTPIHNRHCPPYARKIEARVKAGRPFPDGQRGVWVTCGSDAWEQARKTKSWDHAVLVLPQEECPSRFRWPVAGLDVVVLVAGIIDDGTLERLGTELVYAGSPLVVICDPENENLGGPIVTFKPREKAA